MKLAEQIWIGLLLGAAMPLWSQVGNSPTQPVPAYGVGSGTDNTDDRMMTPPTVSGQSYPTSGTAQERSNYFRGGMAFTTAYTDNALGSVNGQAVSDVSYSLAPFIALDKTTTRLHIVTNYAPGFTFYQKTSSRNEADQNASIDLQYRVTQHVTFSARDGFQKSSNFFNQPFFGSATEVSGGTQQPNVSVVAPVAPVLINSGNVGITWQFAANGMAGVSGMFSNLHYSDQTEVSGLSDSNSQGGTAFYSTRISKMHYIGVSYQYQRLIANPTGGQSETQTHALLLLYTLYASPRFSVSFFGGPQRADVAQSSQTQAPSSQTWSPAAGASMNWQGRTTNIALSYSHIISGGGGLSEAVHMDSAAAFIRQQMTRNLSGSLTGGYAQNKIVGAFPGANNNGHTLSGTASLQRRFGQHIEAQLGYTRIRQSYGNVPVLAATPDTNREVVSISYYFSRPLGR